MNLKGSPGEACLLLQLLWRLDSDERGRVPLLQEEGLESFLEYLRGLIAARAEDDYSALVEGAGELHVLPAL